MKFFITAILAISLLNPLCLCGAVAADAHGADVPADCREASPIDHNHDHQHHHESPCGHHHEEDGHSHSHSDTRGMVNDVVTVPAAPAADLAAWEIPKLTSPGLSNPAPFAHGSFAISPAGKQRCSAVVTGVFRL